MTKLMVGESYSNADVYQKRETGETILELDGFSGPGFYNVSLSVNKGQIIGLTGLQGSGSRELMQCIFGSTHATEGTIKLHGKDVKIHSIHKAMKSKVAMLASSRKENSVIPNMNLLENMYLSEHTLSAGRLPIHKKKEKKKFEKYRALLNIKAQSPESSMNIFRHSTVVGIIAIGMGLICLTGEIDLSVGSMLAFDAGFSVIIFNMTDSIVLTLLFALVFGAACGAVNGALVGFVKMPAFIVTLATMLIYRSFAQYSCQHMDKELLGDGSSVYRMANNAASYQPMYQFGNGKIATIPS